MDSSYNRSTTGTRFRYNPNPTGMDDPGTPESDSDSDSDSNSLAGLVEIYVHHATNIHNICIYDNQDVYAKFSLTYNPDDTVSTRIVNGGGKNPQFNQKIAIKLPHLDAAAVVKLKCEIWMLSRAPNLMEDQLLGFALVPLSQFIGKGEISHDYTLSSTDLFHSPAGTVKLTLRFTPSSSPLLSPPSPLTSSISSEVVLLQQQLDPVDYSRIDFPDLTVVNQNHQMVSEYFHRKLGSFLHLGNFPHLPPRPDCEMASIHDPGGGGCSISSGFLTSTTTSFSFSDERNPSGKGLQSSSPSLNVSVSGSEGNQTSSSSGACPDTPTSRKGSLIIDEMEGKEQRNGTKMIGEYGGDIFAAPPPVGIPNINQEAEESAMQQQIVDMYMRSMQQFTESIAKMKLPMDLDKSGSSGDSIQGIHADSIDHKRDDDIDQQQQQQQKKKKDGSRVFYGSRAFF